MKWMWIQSSEPNKQPSYVAHLLDDLRSQLNFELVDSDEHPEMTTENHPILVHTFIKQQGKIATWINNKLKYKSLIKKWDIGLIVLSDHFVKIDSTLPNILIVNNKKTDYSEEEKNFVKDHSFSFLTYSEKAKVALQNNFPDKKIRLYNPSISQCFQPLEWDATLNIKETYAEGNDYFLVNSIGQNIDYSITILKGFSVFKKWQKSSMKILFLSDQVQTLQEAISNYKYREDVNICNHPDESELANIIAASYCTIHLTDDDSDNIFGLQSAKCNIPILLKKESTLYDWVAGNAFFLEDLTSETLGQAFITMYKAENVRAKYMDYLEQNPIMPPNDSLQLLTH